MRSTSRFLVFLSLLSAPLMAAETAAAISAKHYRALLEDLSAYVKSHPDAADLDQAFDDGLQAAYLLEDSEKMLSFAYGKFTLLKGRSPLPLQELAQTAMFYSQFAYQAGKKADLASFVDEVKALGESSGSPIFGQVLQQIEALLRKPGVGDVLEIRGTATHGEAIDLADLKGKVVLVDFWATWCGPCIAEMPNLKSAYAEFKDKGFEIIGVSIDQSLDPLKKYLAAEKTPWSTLWDPGQKESMADKYGITSIPALFLVGKDGKVAAVNSRGPALARDVARLLAAD